MEKLVCSQIWEGNNHGVHLSITKLLMNQAALFPLDMHQCPHLALPDTKGRGETITAAHRFTHHRLHIADRS